MARAVMLLGDGMYYNAALFGFPTGAEQQQDPQENMDVASLLDIVAKMRSGTRA